MGEHDKALDYYEKSLKINESVKDIDHIDSASTISNIG